MGASLRPTLVSVLTALFFVFCFTGSALGASRIRGETYFVAGHWFQYLGSEEAPGDEREYWLYPHLDGVLEIFEAPGQSAEQGAGPWIGMLGSRFHASQGRFSNRFSAVEVLNELLRSDSMRHRERTVRLLDLYVELLAADATPFYLRKALGARADRHRDDEGRAWVAEALERYRSLTRGLPQVGTRVSYTPADPIHSSDFYRSLIADGYLDIAVIGGNSLDEESGEYHSWSAVEGLRAWLRQEGYSESASRRSDTPVLSEKITRLLGHQVRVRVRTTGGSHRKPRIRRAVANFVDGLAHADVVIYQGHSNGSSGLYYLSESKTGFSKFRLGLEDQRDLEKKCHSVLTKPYQIVALQSCHSYEKYCRPMRSYFDRQLGRRGGQVGFMGTGEVCYFREFIPRYSAFIDLIVKGVGPTAINRRLNAIRPVDDPAPLVLRGVLQVPHTFIVPPGVTIENIVGEAARKWRLCWGIGSDGVRYASSELFPQDRLGDIVQVVSASRGVYGLHRDGRVFYSGRDTEGVTVEVETTRTSGHEFAFIARGKHNGGRSRLFLITRAGEIFYLSGVTGKPTRATWQLESVVAVGNDASGDFIGLDASGKTWVLSDRRWKETEPRPFVTVTPHLRSVGVKGELWRPHRAPRPETR